MTHQPISHRVQDRYQPKEPTQFLAPEKWESAYTHLARTINEANIVGKPPVQKYFKSMKPENLQQEFDGTHKNFKLIY